MSQTKVQLIDGFDIDTSVPDDSLVIDNSGRLLVGTSSSLGGYASKLQVASTSDDQVTFARYTTASSPGTLALQRSGSGTIGTNAIVQDGDNLFSINFLGADGTNYLNAATISAAVDGTPGANDMPGRLVFSTTADAAASPTERMRIANNGNMMLGGITQRNSARFTIDANGANAPFSLYVPSTGSYTNIFFQNPNGNVGSITTVGSSTVYNTSSDYRLKENVTPVVDGITRLQQLKPSRFNFIADPDTTLDGFLAHEVQGIVPEAITGDKDAVDEDGNPEYQGIDQSKLVPLLTAALQEAIGRIETLEAEVAALKAQ